MIVGPWFFYPVKHISWPLTVMEGHAIMVWRGTQKESCVALIDEKV
jgi:hypothetical protein